MKETSGSRRHEQLAEERIDLRDKQRGWDSGSKGSSSHPWDEYGGEKGGSGQTRCCGSAGINTRA